MTAAAPYLSIVVTGRNDDFGGDFNGRFFRALRFNHAVLSQAGVDHEFVFVEWRPVERAPYLATLLEAEFPELGPSSLRCYVVDPAYHDARNLNPRLQFHEFLAKNVGIRRARGRYVLATNTDIYLGRGVIGRFESASLEEGILYRATRFDLKESGDYNNVDWELLEDDRNYDAVNTICPPYFTNASGDFQLLDRGTYHRLGGFNEVYRVAKIHIDSNFCMKAHACGVRLVDLGSPVYHVGRGTFNAQEARYRTRPEASPWGKRWRSSVIYVNGPEWGLARAPERQMDACTSFLEFDWSAVGPMVTLKGVEVPAAASVPRSSTSG